MEQQILAGALLREVARLYIQLQRNCVTYCCDTTVTQCTVLTELGRVSPVTLAELSHRIGFDKSWTSRAVENLVQEGLVVKIPSQTDRRTIQLSLSTLGEVRLRELNQTLNALAETVMEHIPESEHSPVYRALEGLQKALLDLTEDKQLAPGLSARIGPSCKCD
jgi:DNA-binding MarR family transcriptional regulator